MKNLYTALQAFVVLVASIVLIIVLLFAVFGVILAPGAFVKFQQIGWGSHTGYVTAVDQRGYIFRNYEVFFKTDNSSSQEDVYCVNRSNTHLIELLNDARKNRTLVTINYQGVRGIGLGLCHTTEIKSIGEIL